MEYKIIKDNLNNKEKEIFTHLTDEDLKNILDNKKDETVLLLKFGATWCGPCNKIKEFVYSMFLDMPENVCCFDLDVDENIELYSALKKKRMVTTIPAFMVYYCKNKRDHWYIADNNISNSDKKVVLEFFKQIYNNVN